MTHPRKYVTKRIVVPYSQGTYALVSIPPEPVRLHVAHRLRNRLGVSFNLDSANRPTYSISIGGLDSITSLEEACELFESALTDCLNDFQAGLLSDEPEPPSRTRRDGYAVKL